MTRNEIAAMDLVELDRYLAARVGEPFVKPGHGSCCTCQVCGHNYDTCQCEYSIDIGMAWRVVEWFRRPPFGWFEITFRPNGYYANFTGNRDEGAYEETAPLAICRAAVIALEAQS